MDELEQQQRARPHRTGRTLGLGAVAVVALSAVLIPLALNDDSTKSDVEANAGPADSVPDGEPLSLRIVLDTTHGTAGTAIHGHALITNNTGSALTVQDCPDTWLLVGLASDTLQFEPSIPLVACAGPQWPSVPTGTSRWPVTVLTTFLGCSYPGGGYPPNPRFPTCIGEEGNEAPPLPVGTYEVQVIVSGLSPEPTVASPEHVTLSR